ncbi:MAG TPA: cytochrome c [Candidatus Binataceae bacterium]|nr:cytochrome c [Candidatus Binataceae bacterium]
MIKQSLVSAAAIAMAMVAVPAFAAGNVAAGATIVTSKCVGCHGSTGAGDGPELQMLNVTNPPIPWTNKAQMSQLNDDYLSKIINGGGGSVGKSPLMPPFKGKLSDQQISDVIAYIRSLAK